MEKIKYKEDEQGNKKIVVKTDPETSQQKVSCGCCYPCRIDFQLFGKAYFYTIDFTECGTCSFGFTDENNEITYTDINGCDYWKNGVLSSTVLFGIGNYAIIGISLNKSDEEGYEDGLCSSGIGQALYIGAEINPLNQKCMIRFMLSQSQDGGLLSGPTIPMVYGDFFFLKDIIGTHYVGPVSITIS
jgi:hypothetical protein